METQPGSLFKSVEDVLTDFFFFNHLVAYKLFKLFSSQKIFTDNKSLSYKYHKARFWFHKNTKIRISWTVVRFLVGCNQDAQILQVLCITDKSIVKHWNCRKSRRPSSKRLGQCEVWCEAGPQPQLLQRCSLNWDITNLFSRPGQLGKKAKTTLLIRRLPRARGLGGDRRDSMHLWNNTEIEIRDQQHEHHGGASAQARRGRGLAENWRQMAISRR